MQQLEEMAEKVVSRLFANGRTPMEHFGINWKQAERIESQLVGDADQFKIPISEIR